MDLDKELVRAILRDGVPAYRKASERGVVAEKLYDEGRLAWEFCDKHVKQYGVLPSLDLLLSTVIDDKGERIDLSAGGFDTTDALLDKVLERSVLNVLIDGTKKVHEQISKRDAKEATNVFQEIHRKLQKESLSVAKVESLFSLGSEVIDYYKLIQSGGSGIPTPWPTMTAQTMGWWPEDLILLVGRLNSGKTWMLLLLVHAAWMANHKVLICTTEMTRRDLACRFLCMHLRIPYGDFKSGRLGDFIAQKMEQGILALVNEQGLDIIGNGFDFTMDNLEATIEDCKPAILAVDGAYLIKNKGKDRQEQVINTFNDLKRIGIRQKTVNITSTQFNRQAKASEENSIVAENIGITDVAGWNATAAFGLFQTDAMKASKRMGIKPLKVREGVPQSFECEWDLNRMCFDEVGGTNQPAIAITGSDSDVDDDLTDLPF